MTNIGLDIDLKVKNYECGLDNVLKTDITHILNYLKKMCFISFQINSDYTQVLTMSMKQETQRS